MVAQVRLPFGLSTEIPTVQAGKRPEKDVNREKLKTNTTPPVRGAKEIPVRGAKEIMPASDVKPVPGAERFLPLPNSKPLSQEQREKEALVIAWLKEQDEPVTITEISALPFNTENNNPVIGDYQTHGGLGMQQSAVRLILKRLHQQKRVTRLSPRINKNETAHLWVEGWVDMGEE